MRGGEEDGEIRGYFHYGVDFLDFYESPEVITNLSKSEEIVWFEGQDSITKENFRFF